MFSHPPYKLIVNCFCSPTEIRTPTPDELFRARTNTWMDFDYVYLETNRCACYNQLADHFRVCIEVKGKAERRR